MVDGSACQILDPKESAFSSLCQNILSPRRVNSISFSTKISFSNLK